MKNKTLIIFFTTVILFIAGCKETTDEKPILQTNETNKFEKEKKAILTTLNEETKAAFQRDYDTWKSKWVQDPNITKTYINFADSSFSESVGWEEISGFVQNYFDEHPEPEPIPKLLNAINVSLYKNGAWVFYEQQDSLRGLKRETRLMEKIDGEWKIAGMQTTIYGFKN
ncbi:hypothetical protein HME9304_01492 [Flagellimonas maritima]|uniref:SnoaL-like domain-containing protein n=1 Tax=Flagellimonas maritima TaxID=1383885 RepID=A0A2Z4LS17_9FLAO|nr:hypothetical protein [Allomuricauda aurantiaca]AWX44490.1 hypothetical protein HME9304_01492 [Allomuricauda aurantiaca]